jgi:hypothetical protein
LIKRIIITGFLFFICVSVHAFSVILDPGDGTNALGIIGLEIDPGSGELWDITFEADNDHDGLPVDCRDVFVYSACPTLFQNEPGAISAVNQIELALNDDVSIGGNGNPVVLTIGTTKKTGYHVPTLYDSTDCNDPGQAKGTCTVLGKYFAEEWAIALSAEIILTSNVEIAKFTPHVVVIPIPPAAWLFGSALGLLGWIQRKKAS